MGSSTFDVGEGFWYEHAKDGMINAETGSPYATKKNNDSSGASSGGAKNNQKLKGLQARGPVNAKSILGSAPQPNILAGQEGATASKSLLGL